MIFDIGEQDGKAWSDRRIGRKCSLAEMLGRIWTEVNRRSKAIAASRTRLWLLSGWGLRGRRLSRAERSLGMHSSLWQCHLPSHRLDRVGDAPVLPSQSSA